MLALIRTGFSYPCFPILGDLYNITYSGCPVLDILSEVSCPMSCDGCPLLGVLSWVSSSWFPVRVSSPRCPLPCVLFPEVLSTCPVWGVLSKESCPGCLVSGVLSRVSCPGCPVPDVRPGCPVPGVLSQVSCPRCPVPGVLSQVSCPRCLVLAFLSWMPWPGCRVLAVLSWLSCQGCPVLHCCAKKLWRYEKTSAKSSQIRTNVIMYVFKIDGWSELDWARGNFDHQTFM